MKHQNNHTMSRVIARFMGFITRKHNYLPIEKKILKDCIGDNAYANYILYKAEIERAKIFTARFL